MPFKDTSRYQSEDWKEYQRNYQRSWHQRHKEKRLARMYEKKAATYEYVQHIKSQLRCADCGERHPATLQFHHPNSEDKEFNVADAVRNGISLDRIKKEIDKCIVLCANCHAIRHYNMRNKKKTSPGPTSRSVIKAYVREKNSLVSRYILRRKSVLLSCGHGVTR